MSLIDAEVGGENANSFIDFEFADSYFQTRVGASPWFTATENKEASCIHATRLLSLKRYKGWPTYENQALPFPRTGIESEDEFTLYPEDEIPLRVKQATCELVLLLMVDPSFFDSTGLEQFSRVRLVTGAQYEMRPDANFTKQIPDYILSYLRPFLAPSNAEIIRS